MAVDMPSSATKLTYEDLLQLPDDGKRHELLAGDHHVSPSPSLRHQVISLNLAVALRAFVRQRGLGLVLAAPVDVVLTSHDVVEPDLLYVSAGRRAILSDANVAGAPDLVLEILSSWSRRRDEVLKRDLYDRAGVGEYWLVDPEAESVKVLRRAGDATPFARPMLLTRRDSDLLTTPLLPELELSLEDVFAE